MKRIAVTFATMIALPLSLLLLTGTTAHALKDSLQITPVNLQHSGFSLVIEDRGDETLEVALSRDLARSRTFGPDSELLVRRSATLRVHSQSGLLLECDLEPRERKGRVSYRFRIERNRLSNSHLTVAEVDDYRDQTRGPLLGGGTFYGFRLGLFAGHISTAKERP